MNIKKLFITDVYGDSSVTTTAFLVGFIVLCVKLLLSGVTIYGITFSNFTGTEFGIGIGALGGVYALRQNAKDQLPDPPVQVALAAEELPKPPRE